ncbi:MAG: hypothetical protein J7647_21500 [Cyanobacteria bacterium SBLK]|nr:hypothetical protein [Cyanobacteria bacterium SBLK]
MPFKSPFNPLTNLSRELPPRIVLLVSFILQIFGIVGLVGYLSLRNGQKAVNDLALQIRKELTARIERALRAYTETRHTIDKLNANTRVRSDIDTVNLKETHLFWEQSQLFQDKGKLANRLGNFYGDRYDYRARPWYKNVVATGRPSWSEIYINAVVNLPILSANIPVYDGEESLVGVCTTALFFSEEFSRCLQNLEIGKSGETFVMERSGTLRVTSLEELLYLQKREEGERLKETDLKNPLVRKTARALQTAFENFARIQTPQKLDLILTTIVLCPAALAIAVRGGNV